MYEILDKDNKMIASTEDVHDVDAAWDVLTQKDEELAKTVKYADPVYLAKLISQYRPEGFEPGAVWLRVVQTHRVFLPK